MQTNADNQPVSTYVSTGSLPSHDTVSALLADAYARYGSKSDRYQLSGVPGPGQRLARQVWQSAWPGRTARCTPWVIPMTSFLS